MTRAKIKNLILSLCLAFTMLLGVNLTTGTAYAATEEITSRDTNAWGNAIGVTASTEYTLATGMFNFEIPESEESSTIEVTLYDSTGAVFANITNLPEGGTYSKEIEISGSTLVSKIQYSNTDFAVYGIVDNGVAQLGQYVFKYQATVTRADSSTYTTTVNSIYVIFYRYGIQLSQSKIVINQGSALPSTETLRGYIVKAYLDDTTQVSASSFNIDTSQVNVNVQGSYNIRYYYTRGDDTLETFLEVIVQKDLSGYEMELTYNSNSVEGTASQPYDFGLFSSTSSIILNLTRNDAEVLLSINATFDQEGFNISTETVNATTTKIQILPPRGFNKVVNGVITVDSYNYAIPPMEFVFVIDYSVDIYPEITFTSDDIRFNKKCIYLSWKVVLDK